MSGRALNPPAGAAIVGKLPAHGDFVRRGDPTLAIRLDTWLTHETDRLAGALGDDLDERLMALPTWCFALADGTAGALAASSDSIGRIYPLIACGPGDETVAFRIADAVAAAQADLLSAEALAALLDVPATVDPLEAGGRTGWWRHDGAGEAYPDECGLPVGASFARLFMGTC